MDYRDYNYSVDLIKGICVLEIILTHSNIGQSTKKLFLFPFWVEMAVPMFMIISGYLYARSYNKKINTLEDLFCLPNYLDKVIRYSIPYALFVTFEILYQCVHGQMEGSICEIVFFVLRGGYGKGSYYFPIMIQFIFIAPVIYCIIRKWSLQGVVLCAGLNVIYEILKTAYMMNEECYRLLVFRYIFVIGWGCYLACDATKASKIPIGWGYVCGGGGLAFIYLVNYKSYVPKIFTYWTGTSFLASLSIMIISYYLISVWRFRCVLIEYIGKASYHIFFVQMLWFAYGCKYISNFEENSLICVFLNILVCCTFGVVFYALEQPINHKIIAYVNRKISIR